MKVKIGFLTNCMAWIGITELDKIADWAVEKGFEDLEVGPNIPLKEEVFQKIKGNEKIDISAFIYCRNFIGEDAQEAQKHREALMERIRFAPVAGIKKIICSTGVSPKAYLAPNGLKYDPEESVEEVVEVFKAFVDLAEKYDVKLCFENCPMMGNIAISPYMWDVLFEKLDSDKVGLAFDPSHFIWQFMDPYAAILKYGHKIFHVHGKDCEIQWDKLNETGILHNFKRRTDNNIKGENALKKIWWRYRLPGLGDINWNKVIANLQETGYDGTISIEHEDPVWHGDSERVQAALLKSKKHLMDFV